MSVYDEDGIAERLSALDRRRRTAFAAACAERLLPLYRRYADGQVDDRTHHEFRSALTALWAAVEDDGAVDGRRSAALEHLVPDEDAEDWSIDAAYAQNAAIATVYALDAFTRDHGQSAVWAARQVYEVADSAAQELLEVPDFSPESLNVLADSEVVQSAIAAIASDLEAVAAPRPSWRQLAGRCRGFGETWAASLP